MDKNKVASCIADERTKEKTRQQKVELLIRDLVKRFGYSHQENNDYGFLGTESFIQSYVDAIENGGSTEQYSLEWVKEIRDDGYTWGKRSIQVMDGYLIDSTETRYDWNK